MTYNINVGPFYIGFPAPAFLPIKVFATMNNVNIIRKNNLTNKCGPADSPRHVLYTTKHRPSFINHLRVANSVSNVVGFSFLPIIPNVCLPHHSIDPGDSALASYPAGRVGPGGAGGVRGTLRRN